MLIWRICARQHAKRAFRGEGAQLCGGRWNPPGIPVVYCSPGGAYIALCAMCAALWGYNPTMPRQRHYYGLNHLHFITPSTYRRARLFDSERFSRHFVATLAELRVEQGFKPNFDRLTRFLRSGIRKIALKTA